MKVNGIITECNPFHNGHKYILEEAKKQTGADYTILVMSGDFMQRGAPALVDKFTRTKMALLAGADLVLEIPGMCAVSSAEYFATGAITLLDKLGVVTHLAFGSESGDIASLQEYAEILLTEPDGYLEALRRNLRQGQSYPLARNNALVQYDPSLYNATSVLASPNNILAIEYLKCLRRRDSRIIPLTTKRFGGYHDKYMSAAGQPNQIASALAIRQSITSGQANESNGFASIRNVIPEECFPAFVESLNEHGPMDVDDFSSMLFYKLLQEKPKGYTAFLDVTAELSDRISNHLGDFVSFSQFCDLLKSKDRTYTRVSRCLMHILLDIKADDMENEKMLDYAPYARILGFRRSAEPLLSEIKIKSSIPLLSKLATAKEKLYSESYRMLQKELRMNEVYAAARGIRTGKPMTNEVSTPIVIIE